MVDVLLRLGVHEPVAVPALVGGLAGLASLLMCLAHPASKRVVAVGSAALHFPLRVDLLDLPQLVQAVVAQVGGTAIGLAGLGAVTPRVVALVGASCCDSHLL